MKIELSNFTIEYDKEIDYMSNIIFYFAVLRASFINYDFGSVSL